MAEPDPRTPQAVDPEVTANLTRLLQIRGPLGILNVLDTIVPVVSLGDVVTPSVIVREPFYTSTNVFSAGIQNAAPPNIVHADTGPLAEGVYDLQYFISIEDTPAILWAVEHRNAANSANLAIWRLLTASTGGKVEQSLGYEFAFNERLRILNLNPGPAGVDSVAVIFARIRA